MFAVRRRARARSLGTAERRGLTVDGALGRTAQAPRAARVPHCSTPEGGRRAPAAHTPLSPHWIWILASLDGLIKMLRENHVESFFIRKLFTQVSLSRRSAAWV